MALQFLPLSVLDVIDQTPQAYTLVFKRPPETEWNFLAGQYLTLRIFLGGEEYRRPYSLSSSPLNTDTLAITIKRMDGGIVSNYLRDTLEVGDTVESLPPMGNFFVEPTPIRIRHYILIGGGSGITPLISILRTVLAVEPDSRVTLWYGNRREEAIIFREELSQLKETYKERFTLVHVLSQPSASWKGPKGRLDPERVYEYILELFMVDEFQKGYYLCGPEGLMEAAQQAMERHAIDPRHVFQEHFVGHVFEMPEETSPEEGIAVKEAPKAQSIQVILDGERYEVLVKPGQSILDAALEEGLDAPYSCKGGVCTTCMGRVLNGEVEHSDAVILLDSEKEKGVILTCQARPISDEVEVEYGY